MSYTKQTWANGDIITAAKLNHMEDGIAGVEADVSSLDTKLLASMPHDTASGSIANFPDGAAMPVRDLSVDIEPVQAGSGDPSPDNVRPISGWTECKVTRTKNNLCSSGIGRWLWSNGVRYANTSGAYCGTNDKMPIKGGETYFLSFTNTESTNAIYINWFNGETFLETTAVWNANSWTGTAPENANYVAITFSNASAYTGDPTVSNVMLNIGSTATAYEAYQGQTYTIDLDGTRYGGTLDVTTGKLMVDRAMVDMGTLNWSSWEQGGSLIFNSHISAKMPVRDVPCISSQYAYNPAIVSSWSDLLNGQMTGQAGGDVVYVRDTRYSSNADFKTGVSGVQLVYPLATPIEVDLDPVTIETLLGTNNIFADCGDTTVDYYADTTLFVNKKIAAAVAALS